MPVGYHVDRSNQLEVGDTLDLQYEPFVNPEDRVVPDDIEADAINEKYPKGLSRHGSRYAFMKVGRNDTVPVQFQDETTPFIGVYELENPETGDRKPRNSDPTSAIYEWMFELVRRSEFPDRPSRFQSFFGCETEEEAAAFRSDFGPDAQIVEIEYDDGHRADMDLLSTESFAHGLHQASTYWRGESGSDDPIWELLMQPPVDVVGIVD